GAETLKKIRAREQQVLHLAVPGAEEDGLGRTGGAARRMQHDARALAGCELHAVVIAEGRMLDHTSHQVGLGEWRELSDVVEGADVTGLEAVRAPAPAVERHLPRPADDSAKPTVLKRPQLVTTEARDTLQKRRSQRILDEHLPMLRLVE